MIPSSVLPPSRFFPAPEVPFDTEAALIAAGNVATRATDAITLVAAEDAPNDPRTAIVRGDVADDGAAIILARLSGAASLPLSPQQRIVIVESQTSVAALRPSLTAAGLVENKLTFFGGAAREIVQGERLELEPMVGDDAWRGWASVEREILAEAIAPAPLTDALLDRSVQFKRKQQRDTPPIRRFIARRDGAPIAMIGYAPFAPCDLGFGPFGSLIRLRDVAVLPRARRHGVGAALIRGLVAVAIDECRASQVLICGASSGAPAALYRRIGARPVAGCTMFSGNIGS